MSALHSPVFSLGSQENMHTFSCCLPRGVLPCTLCRPPLQARCLAGWHVQPQSTYKILCRRVHHHAPERQHDEELINICLALVFMKIQLRAHKHTIQC